MKNFYTCFDYTLHGSVFAWNLNGTTFEVQLFMMLSCQRKPTTSKYKSYKVTRIAPAGWKLDMILLLSVTCMNLTSTWYIYLVYSLGWWVGLARCCCRSKRIKCWQFWEIMQVKKVLTKLPKKLNSSYIFPFFLISHR